MTGRINSLKNMPYSTYLSAHSTGEILVNDIPDHFHKLPWALCKHKSDCIHPINGKS